MYFKTVLWVIYAYIIIFLKLIFTHVDGRHLQFGLIFYILNTNLHSKFCSWLKIFLLTLFDYVCFLLYMVFVFQLNINKYIEYAFRYNNLPKNES
jgi:hypothetical protein